jgi:hypothetical protein
MLNTIFKPSNESFNVKQLVAHMLRNMNFDKYQKFLQRAEKSPAKDHKFVLFEYVETPSDAEILRSERVPGSRMTINNVIHNPDFDENMARLFGTSDRHSWYTRCKIDYTKSLEGKLTDSRQLVLFIKRELEDYSDMPGLISAPEVPTPVLNPEENAMPSLIPMPTYNYIGSGVNQTIWSPYQYSYGYLGQTST